MGVFSLTEALSLKPWVLISSAFVKAHKFLFGKYCRNPQGSGLRYSKCNYYLLINTLPDNWGASVLYLCMFILSAAQQLLSFTCTFTLRALNAPDESSLELQALNLIVLC